MSKMIEELGHHSFLGVRVEQMILVLYPLILMPAIALWLRELRYNQAKNLAPKGYTKLGLSSSTSSHLTDEGDEKYTIQDSQKPTWSVKALFVHPIKSCAGVEVESAALDGAGLLWDRKFAFAELLPPPNTKDSPNEQQKPKWTFRTLRQPGYEKMTKIRPEIWLKNGSISPKDQNAEADGFLVVKFPLTPTGLLAPLDRFLIGRRWISGESAFRVPLVPSKGNKYPSEEVAIWRDSPRWLNYGEHVPTAFQHWLGAKHPVTLFRVDPRAYRQVFRCAPRKDDVGYQPIVGFADAYPVHLLNLASVRDVANRVKGAIPQFTARRFRSNIVVTGGSTYDEDDWKIIKVGDHTMYCACHTIRCRLPNVDPDTAVRDPIEPDKTLKSFRCIDDGDPLNAALGLQLVPASDKIFELRVGDEITVLERGEHHYIKQ